jgi:hypothetical protein
MKVLTRLLQKSLLVAAFGLVFFVAPQASAQPANAGTPVGSLVVPNRLTKDDVKDVVIMSLAGRGWGIQEKTDGKVVGYLKHRSNEATLTIIFDEKHVDLFCVGYEINKKTGERKKPELPNGWLNYIRGDLTKKLNQATATK